MEASFAGEPRASREGGSDDTAPGMSLAMYGALCRRLEASWHVLRHCRIAIKGEEYVLQLVIVHRDFGIGLIAFRAEQYTFPELAIRLTRDLLRRHGFHERFGGHLPVVFIAADPKDASDMPVRIARAFADERRIEVSDPFWAEWAARLLGRTASEGRQGDTGGTTPESPIDLDTPVDEDAAPRKSSRHSDRHSGRLLAFAAAPLILGGGIAGAFASGFLGASLWPAGGHAQAVKPVPAVVRTADGVRDCSARLMSEARTASYLGLDVATFQARRAALQSAGFPEPEPITGGYDRAAIDRWLDRRVGMN